MSLLLELAGLPRAWRGPAVERVELQGPVAVIGDMHGRADLLKRLLDELGAMPIISVGDVCDRGPDTHGVLEVLVERNAKGVLGNHDLWFACWACGEGLDEAHRGMGGAATLRSYGADKPPHRPDHVPQAHCEWLLSLPIVIDLTVDDEDYWIVHAGVPNSVPLAGLTLETVVPYLAKHEPMELMWPFTDIDAMLPTGRTIIMGHKTHREPKDNGFVIAVDTGAGNPGGRLTAVVLPARRFVTVGP